MTSFSSLRAQGEQLRTITTGVGIVITVVDIPCITEPSQLPFPITVFPNPAAPSGVLNAESSEIITDAILVDESNFILARMSNGNETRATLQVPEIENGLYKLIVVAKNQAFAFVVLVN